MSAPAASGDLALYRRLARFSRPQAPLIAGLAAVSLAATPLALLAPLPLKVAVDSALGSHPLPGILDAAVPGPPSHAAALAVAAGLFVVTALLSQLQQLAAAGLGAYTGELLVLRLRADLFRHVQRLSLSYHDEQGTADSTYRIQYDATAVQWIAVTGLIPAVTALFTVAGMVYVTARVDWQLALVALAVAPALAGLAHAYRRRVRARWHRAKELESSALSVVQEVLGGLRLVKAFAQEEREQERFVARSSQGMRARVRLALVEGAFGGLIGLTTAAGSAAVLYIGVHHVQTGRLTLGDLLLVMGYLTQLYAPLQTLSRSAGRLQSSLASAERIFALLDQSPDVPERPGARGLERAAGRVELRGVSFGYRPGRPVLQDVSLAVPPGASVGIAGATGAGKTTLISLLTRFWDPTSGSVLLDGVDLRDYRLADLRRQFAIVLQEPVLFSTSVLENISYARPDAGRGEVVAAARAAGAHEFIERLPEGYDTVVGERGLTLSGGERQRISLARAFLKDAPILILDEPTSSLDLRTEASIMAATARLMRGRTTFVIAHRPSTLARCSMRVAIHDGRLAGPPARGRRPAADRAVAGTAGA